MLALTRLAVYLARRRPVAVILRTGPARCVEMIRWDVQKDLFERGQWMRTKIYEERCDISPSGEHFLYFTGRWKSRDYAGGYTGTWTALCEPPYFTAKALWPQGDTWGGGGSFADDHTLQLGHNSAHPDHPLRGFKVQTGHYLREDERRQRDGWIVTEWKETRKVRTPALWTKLDPSRTWKLIMPQRTWNQRNRPIEFSVSNTKETTPLLTFAAHWADWDHHGRLVSAQGGQLLSLKLGQSRQLLWNLLEDFTADPFRNVPPR